MVNKKSNTAPVGLWIARIFVGLLFIFSGLIKANDPLGFSFKLEEYFEVFHITFLNGTALALAIFLCSLEMFLGFALLIGSYARKVAWGLLLLIIFFAFLTFYSAVFKVVQTCGCFGDAIVLTPWQSFIKDLVLLVLIIILFKHRTKIHPLFDDKTGHRLIIIGIVLSLAAGLYTYNFMPVFDFLPYKVGANIPDEMRIPPNAQPDEYRQIYHLKNSKTGDTRVMDDKEYIKSNIWKDNNWQIAGTPESQLIKKGFTPKIQDLSVGDAQKNDYTRELISNPYYTIWIVAYDLNRTNADAVNRINAICVSLTENYNVRTILLTSNSAQAATAFAKEHHLISEIFYADAVPLKEMVRANPGILLIKSGTVVNKWNSLTLPNYDDLVKQYFSKQ